MLELKNNKQLRDLWHVLNPHMNWFNSQLHIDKERMYDMKENTQKEKR